MIAELNKYLYFNSEYAILVVNFSFQNVSIIKNYFNMSSHGQNQSRVAKHERAGICISSENVKICPFSVCIKNMWPSG